MSPSVAAGDQQADWQSQLLDLENQARRAFLERNIERLKSLWSADLVVNSPINRVLARDEVFDLLRKGVIAHTSFDIHIELSSDRATSSLSWATTSSPAIPARRVFGAGSRTSGAAPAAHGK